MRLGALAGVWLALVACNGGDTGVSALRAEIAVSHETMDFEGQPIFEPAFQDLFITNSGQAFSPITLEFNGGGGKYSAEPLEYAIERNESLQIPIQFLPSDFLDYNGTLTVHSEDEDSPALVVTLVGHGVPAPVPDIEVDPNVLDWGTVGAGGGLPNYVTLRNVGDAPLTLGQIDTEGSGAFRMPTGSDPSGGTIAPDSVVNVILDYSPVHDDGDSGTMLIRSDDPDEPEIEVLLLGNGGGDFEYPVALIDCPGTARPPEDVILDGSGSSDPAGLDLEYEWSMTGQPEGSQTTLNTFVGDSTQFFADVAGEYEVQLVVTNEVGVSSAPEKCTIDAVPEDELHIELTWDTSQADLDIHLLQAGADLFEKPGDANWCNPEPNWGNAGTDADDARLDIDDLKGFGPENINVQFPENGSYFVKVHYFDENGDDEVEATVRVYLFGILVEEVDKIMARNEVWDVGQANMPDGTFGVQNTPLWDSDDRFCF